MIKYRGYRIEQTKDGFRITRDDGSDSHTHIKSRNFCKSLIDFVMDKKVPTRVSNYILISCIRLSDDEGYIQKVNELLKTRKRKTKQNYYNHSTKKPF